MSDDIEFCLESRTCKNKKCYRHESNIIYPWMEHSYMSFKDTEFCKAQKRTRRTRTHENAFSDSKPIKISANQKKGEKTNGLERSKERRSNEGI